MSLKIDVVVIGGGPGGTPAAMHLASKGKKVLLVEKSGKLGGACLFVGCIPSKIIKHGADEYHSIRNTPPWSLQSSAGPEVFWEEIRRRMDHILSMRSEAALQKIRQMPNVKMIPGTARFISNNEVEIEEITGDRSAYVFDNAIIATGSAPAVPAFEGNAVPDLLTSELLFNQKALPKSMVIIGGGPIGVELAQMLTKLNIQCTIIEMMGTILHGVVEPEFIHALTDILEKSNIPVYPSSKVLKINKTGSGFSTLFTDASGVQRDVRSEQVLVAAGRKPNIEDLNLKAMDIQFDQRGIIVNEHLQTSVEKIYALGDVIAGPKFAHTATYEAHIAAANILSGRNVMKVDFSKNSWVLFSDPEIASVGYTEAQAVKDKYDIMTGTYDYRIDATAQINGLAFGYLKFIVDRKTLTILGIHICTQGASSIIGEAALIVSKGLTLLDVAQTVHPHPTLTEAFGFLAMNMFMGA